MKFLRLFLVVALIGPTALAADPAVSGMLSAGRVDDAIRALNTLVAANPRNTEAYGQLCRAYYFLEDYDNAIANCERAVQLDPKSSSYHLWLGRAYGDKAEHSGPIAALGLARRVGPQFEQAVQLSPSDVKARADLSEFYASAPGLVGGGEDKARRIAEESIKFDPAAAANMRAQIALGNKDYATAEREANLAIQKSNNSPHYMLELARIYGKQKHWKEMESTISQAMADPNKGPEDRFFAGELLVGNGRNLGGAIAFLRAYLAGPTDESGPAFRAYFLIGKALEKMGDKSGAAKEYRSALQLASNYRRAQDALRRLTS